MLCPTRPHLGRDKSGPYAAGHRCARPYSHVARILCIFVSFVSLFQVFYWGMQSLCGATLLPQAAGRDNAVSKIHTDYVKTACAA